MLSKKHKEWWTEGFSQEAKAVFDLMDSDPAPTKLKILMASAIDALVASGDFDNIIQLLVVLDTLPNSLTDWKGNQNAIAVNSPTFDAYDFIGFDASTNFLNTQKQANNQNNNYVGLYVHTSSSGSRTALGARFNSNRIFAIQNAVNNISRNYDNLDLVGDAGDLLSDTYYSIVRTASNARDFRKNGVSMASDANSAFGAVSLNLFIGSRDNGGTADQFWGGKISAYISGNKDLDDLFVFNILKTMIDDIRLLG